MMFLDYWSNVAKHAEHRDGANSDAKNLEVTVEEAFRAYAPMVYNVACGMLHNQADAEDVTQDVLLQVIRKLNSFRGDGRLAAWLHRVTVNAALLHRRKSKWSRQGQVDAPWDVLTADWKIRGTSVPARSADQHMLDNELSELIDKAIARLPDIYRDVYVLADVEGLSNAEIGAILQLGVQAVKSRLHRSRMMMREALVPYCGHNH
ncbi:MAG TPA: sigma-70 family RNA polymerase sigma factor [Bryobacteraceae bacterium]|jgi:RNA polymerase sigma-70 factor (ECF subfamily)